MLDLIKDLFKEIAVLFDPQEYSSTEEILRVRAKEIFERLTKGKLQTLALKTCKAPDDDIGKDDNGTSRTQDLEV